MELVVVIIQALWLIIPAYMCNAIPPLVNGRIALDMKKRFKGHRILGDGKTVEGSISGVLFGFLGGVLQVLVFPYMPPEFGFFPFTITTILLLCIGAVLGDCVASFMKRRAGLKRGRSAPFLDQLDFIAGSLGLLSLVYVPKWEIIGFIVIITPVLHLFFNAIAYILGVENEPW